jgi:hypothetical protein
MEAKETKKCTKCLQEKTIDLFYSKKAKCKECIKIYRINSYKKNPEIQKERSKKNRELNNEKINQYLKEWRIKNKHKQKEYNELRWKNKKEECISRNKKYWIENKELMSIKNKEYYNKNKKSIIKKNINYEKEKIKKDEIYYLRKRCRDRIRKAFKLKGEKKDKRTIELIGCTFEEFKKHIEIKFTEGMNWGNRGLKGWHIDHIIPLSSAKNEKELQTLCHYTNTQPLWWQDNLKKSNKM